MLDFGNRKDLMFLFAIGVLVVMAFLIFSLIMIWKPKDNKDVFVVGDYDGTIIDESEIVSEYVNEFSKLLSEENYDVIYDMLSEDYLSFSKLKKEKLKDKLEDLGLCNQGLKLESYTSNSMSYYNNIYNVTAATSETNKTVRFIIKEKSPRDFEISFDDIIWYSASEKSQYVENVEMKIISSKYTTTKAQFSISVINHNKNSVYLNNSGMGDTFLLSYDANNALRNPIASAERAKTIELKPDEKLDCLLTYSTNDILISNVHGIVIKDVKYSGDEVANMKFSMYN